ncbi:hypothetical protein VNO77_01421 [Canavalia gladiata]|uniref:Uncharacterized protein n=1 Tax=Canavalia gladiata TaxID=3824 RepID=A0AAN9MRV1_CANGL
MCPLKFEQNEKEIKLLGQQSLLHAREERLNRHFQLEANLILMGRIDEFQSLAEYDCGTIKLCDYWRSHQFLVQSILLDIYCWDRCWGLEKG